MHVFSEAYAAAVESLCASQRDMFSAVLVLGCPWILGTSLSSLGTLPPFV